MLLLIVIFLLVVLLLLAFTAKVFRSTGGFDESKFKPAMKQPNPKDYENDNINQDKYFKSLLYKHYRIKLIDGKEVKGYVPDKINYISGGFPEISSINEINKVARERLQLNKDASYEPDFIIEISNNKYLIIEFDEGNDYHQDETIFRYQTKNLIYSEILSSSDVDQNIVIMRITYNSGVNQNNKNKNDHRKVDTENLTILYVDKIIKAMMKDRIRNQYVLMRLEADSLKIKRDIYHTHVEELIGIKAKDKAINDLKYPFFQIDLNTKTFWNEDLSKESVDDYFDIKYYFKKKRNE